MQKNRSCSLDCEQEFEQCMLYALDGFLMGACSEQLENCEDKCSAKKLKF